MSEMDTAMNEAQKKKVFSLLNVVRKQVSCLFQFLYRTLSISLPNQFIYLRMLMREDKREIQSDEEKGN